MVSTARRRQIGVARIYRNRDERLNRCLTSLTEREVSTQAAASHSAGEDIHHYVESAEIATEQYKRRPESLTLTQIEHLSQQQRALVFSPLFQSTSVHYQNGTDGPSSIV